MENNTLQIKRGNKVNLTSLLTGEMALCLDTDEVFAYGSDRLLKLGPQEWGHIDGNISNQDDLSSALAQKSDVGHTHSFAGSESNEFGCFVKYQNSHNVSIVPGRIQIAMNSVDVTQQDDVVLEDFNFRAGESITNNTTYDQVFLYIIDLGDGLYEYKFSFVPPTKDNFGNIYPSYENIPNRSIPLYHPDEGLTWRVLATLSLVDKSYFDTFFISSMTYSESDWMGFSDGDYTFPTNIYRPTTLTLLAKPSLSETGYVVMVQSRYVGSGFWDRNGYMVTYINNYTLHLRFGRNAYYWNGDRSSGYIKGIITGV